MYYGNHTRHFGNALPKKYKKCGGGTTVDRASTLAEYRTSREGRRSHTLFKLSDWKYRGNEWLLR